MHPLTVEDVPMSKPMKLQNVEDMYPLSPMQQGVLFHSLYEPGSGVYFIEFGCRIDGNFDVFAFKKAWDEVVRRHTILRTSFLWEGLNRPVQVVRKSVVLPWREEDWRGATESEAKDRWTAFLLDERRRGFNYKEAPLMRLALMRISEDSYYFGWNTHHLLLDGWCRQIVVGEVLSLYEAYREGHTLQLKQPRLYRDYIAWLQKQDEARAEAFWREQLKGLRAQTRLVTGRERRELKTGEPHRGQAPLRLNSAVSAKLEEIARKFQVTLNTVIQAAYAILVSRYSGESDVIFGATVSGRLEGTFDEMVGLFINTLPVRVQVDGAATLPDFMKGLRKLQAQLVEYEYSPLLKVQRWSEVPPGESLFEHIFVFENYPIDAAIRQAGNKSGITLSETSVFEATNYPLALEVRPGPEHFLCFHYSTHEFEPEPLERAIHHLGVALEEMAARPEMRVGEVSLLSSQERQQLLVEWNPPQNSSLAAASRQCLQRVFEQQVERTPQAIAVVQGRQQWSYAELNRRANQMGHYLRQRGVGLESRVGVWMQRRPELVSGILGILKAGGAYVALDSNTPAERGGFIYKDAGVKVVLTDRKTARRVRESGWSGEVVEVEGQAEEISRASAEKLESEVEAENLAYVVYTSGSTGEPKGTEVPHRSVPGFLWDVEYAEFNEQQRILQHSSLSWDALTLELWSALLRGGRCVLYEGEMLTPEELQRMVQEHGVTTVWLTSSVFSLVVAQQVESLRGLKQVLTGGEAVSLEHVRQARKQWPELRVVNGYGPSECTVFSSCYEVKGELGERAKSVPIGKPVGDRRMYVLDGEMNLSPVEMTGEVYIGGPAVARGYLRRAGLTAEKFVPDGVSGGYGERLYRTGDLGRWRGDGELEFVGRTDEQVKIRGYRIEPGEIEAVLAQQEEVGECVVVVQPDRQGEKRLVAYIVSTDKESIRSHELRRHLENRLPEYMVPSAFIQIDSLPLTAHGKLDLHALPQPEEAGQQVELLPCDEIELQLASIWEELLNISYVDRTQTFFELGGHSLLAIRLVRKIKERFSQDIPLAAVLRNPTLEQLAGLLRQGHESTSHPNLVPIRRTGSKRPLFFVHPGGGGVGAYRHVARLLEDQPFYAFQAIAQEEIAMETMISVEERAARYLKGVFEVQPHGPYLLGGWSFGAYVAYEMALQLRKQGHDVAALFLLDVPADPPRRLPCDGDDAEQLVAYLKGMAKLSLDGFHDRSPQERLQHVVDQMVAARMIVAEVELSQVSAFVRSLRNRIQSLFEYQMRPYDGTITLIRALDSGPDGNSISDDPTLGFAMLSPRTVQVRFVAGTHEEITRPPHVRQLAEVITKSIHDAEAGLLSAEQSASDQLHVAAAGAAIS